MKSASSQHGFTLIELMVALLVLAVLGVVLASGMNQVTRWYHQLSDEMSASSQLLKAQALLMSDLLQLAPRSISDVQGTPLPACLSYADGGFECTRFDNREGGSGLMRIGYVVDKEGLWRLRWPSLDRAGIAEPLRQQVLTEVTAMTVEWLDATGQTFTQWPPAGANALTQLPSSINVVLLSAQQEVVRMVFPVSERQP
ncbi:MAG: type II secretion system protein GspJ [Gammaproteobacteria bacterium]|nr:type II secretion system protein GspJ [Gammaproteobacteria bacterium]